MDRIKRKEYKSNLYVKAPIMILAVSLLQACMPQNNNPNGLIKFVNNPTAPAKSEVKTEAIKPMSQTQRDRIIRARNDAIDSGLSEKYAKFIGNWSDGTNHIQIVAADIGMKTVVFIYKNPTSGNIEILVPSDMSTKQETILMARSLELPSRVINLKSDSSSQNITLSIQDGKELATNKLEESGNTTILTVPLDTTQKGKLDRIHAIPLFNTQNP